MSESRGRRVVSRRAAIGGGAAVAAAVAGAGTFAWWRSDPGPADQAQTATRRPSPTPSALVPTGTPRPPAGRAILPAFARIELDTFDALKAVEPAVAEILGHTHSRLVAWADPANGLLGPDLAASWEQPDETTWTLNLQPGAAWHDREPVLGRSVSAEDVVEHFRRLMALRDEGRLAPGLARDFAALETATAQPDGTVTLTTTTPDALFLAALASLFAFIQPPEMAEVLEAAADPLSVDLVVGAGPFLLESLGEGAVFVPHPSGHRPAGVEQLVMGQPHGSGEPARMRFLAREIDHFLARDRRDLQALAAEIPADGRQARYENTPTVSTFFVGAPPWNNLDLLRGLSGALNRSELISRLHGGQAAPSGPVPPAQAAFGLSEEELAAYPGYGTDADADAAAARALWEAAGGPALGPVLFDIPSIYDPLYSASSVVVERLVEVLGPAAATAEVHSYPVISSRVLGREYGSGQARTWFGWAPPMTAPDPTRELLDTFRSGQPGWAASGLEDGILDGLLDAAMADFDLESRAEGVRAASRRILDLGGAGVVHWLLQTGTLFRQPYLQGPPPTAFSVAHLDSAVRVGSSHPDYPQGR